jgi:hypothetical protein
MAAFVKFQSFVGKVGLGEFNLDSDDLFIALTNTQPTAATDNELADISQVANGNGYTTGGTQVANNAYSQTGGVGSLTGDDVVFTASGSLGPLRYAVLYDGTASGDPLIGYWDYASSITLAAAETFTVNFGSTIITIT